jgi:L-aminopeptidase/D-esterase-like protein
MKIINNNKKKNIKKNTKKTKRKINKSYSSILSNDHLLLKPSRSYSKYLTKISFPGIRFSCVDYHSGIVKSSSKLSLSPKSVQFEPVGLTYIDFGQNGAKCYMDPRGGFTDYTSTLTTHEKQLTTGICIAGGSILGLEAGSGIIAESLKQSKYRKWFGINTTTIYSSNLYNPQNRIYPDKDLGRFALNHLSNRIYSGQVGAGLGASKGQGAAFAKTRDGIRIFALVVNNALGDIYKNGIKQKVPGQLDINKMNLRMDHTGGGIRAQELVPGRNTTITVLITDLDLDNDELKQMSHQVGASIGEVIRPYNTFFDGDIMYSCSTQKKRKWTRTGSQRSRQLLKFFSECTKVVHRAIFKSIQM